MDWLVGALGILKALPDLLKLIASFITWLHQQDGTDPKTLVQNIGQAFVAFKQAESHEERQNAAKDLAGVIARLP